MNLANIFTAICLLCCTYVNAQDYFVSPTPQAREITVVDGISIGQVNAITQTQQGIMWIGTTSGLIRFDGYHARRYQNQPDQSNTLSHNNVVAIVEGPQQNLWIATDGGLNKFDPQIEQFSPMILAVDNADQTAATRLFALIMGNDNSLWVATDVGLKRFNLSVEAAVAVPTPMSMLSTKSIRGITLDSHNNLWVSTANSGLYRYDRQHLRHYQANDRDGLNSNHVHQLYEDPQGHYWLTSDAGLHQYHPDADKFNYLAHSNRQKPIDVNNIIADHQGNLWLGTTRNGIYKYNPTLQRFYHLSHRQQTQQALKQYGVGRMIRDHQGSIWMATDKGLVFMTKATLDIITVTSTLENFNVTDIAQLDNDTIAMIGNHQLLELDLNQLSIDKPIITEHRAYKVSKGQQNNLWLATLGQGLQHYNRQTKTLEKIDPIQRFDSQNPIIGIHNIIKDSPNQLWLMPFPDLPDLRGGLIHYNQSSKTYQHYLSSTFIGDLLRRKEGQLLISSDNNGLMTFDADKRTATPWHNNILSTPRLINDIFEDDEKSLWLGTKEQGLAYFNPQSNQFEFITTDHGLLSNNIVSIIADKQHNLWLASDKGLSRYNPQSHEIMNIDQQDGLSLINFYKRSGLMAADGRLLFGSSNGLIMFDPNNFKAAPSPPPVFISDFKLFNQSVDWQDQTPHNPLKKPIGLTKALVLNHENYMFSFSFATTEYIRPDKIKFAYKMEGLDENWVYTNAENRVASYTTLKPNQYQFKVKVSNRDGVWSEQTASIRITVLPPWWLSWQACIGYFFLLVLTVYYFIRTRTKTLVHHAIALEESVALRTKELQHSRDQVSELLIQKQQLFASVSHEFRTPLTLILSPVEYLLSEQRGQPVKKELQLVKRNGRRLLRMVDQLLEFAKLELHGNSEIEQVSLKQTVDIILSSFELLVKSKQITLSVNQYSDVTLCMIPDSLNKILLNILSNAFKYSPPSSAISVTITNHNDDDNKSVTIEISDTGVGIGEQDMEAVFERFNRATHGHCEVTPGAGIGLALVKELVEANHGDISLQSTLGQGSTFTVKLPCMEHNGEQAPNDDESSKMQLIISEQLNIEMDSVKPSNNSATDGAAVLSTGEHKTILIVDDNPDLRELLCQQLDGPYQCVAAENGQVGLELARQQLPDLVISDVMMPLMDGYELTNALKTDELTSHIPVILLTAKGSMENRLKGLQLLVDDYLAKPFNIEELMLRIHNILTIRDIIKQRYKQVIDEVDPQTKIDALNVNAVEQSFIQRVNNLLNQYHDDGDFCAKVLSRELGVSERQLQRKLKAQFDLGFPELLRNYRLNKAIEMLRQGHRVSIIYHTVGFTSHSYFSSCFKAKFGQTPKAYQQQL